MGAWETFAPVVSASTVQLALIMRAAFGVTTQSMDFTNAFVHAELPKQDCCFIELPKGRATKDGSDCALHLKRALCCGSRGSLKRFITVLKDSCIQRGFAQSKLNPSLLFKGDMMILRHCDDQIVCCKHQRKARQLMKELSAELALTDEGSLADCLGIHFETSPDGTFEAAQTGRMDEIIELPGCALSKALHPEAAARHGETWSLR